LPTTTTATAATTTTMNFQQSNTTLNPFSQMTPSSPYTMNTSSYFQPTAISEPLPPQGLLYNQQPFLQPQQPQQQPMSNPWSTNTLF
jgi:hypothetical protein